ACTEEFVHQLQDAARLTPSDTLARLGSTLEAHRSVVTAIACFALSPESYLNTIASALSLGGDVDTVAAMAGAISGAHLGIESIPTLLLNRLENESKGRSDIEQIAIRLYDRTTQS